MKNHACNTVVLFYVRFNLTLNKFVKSRMISLNHSVSFRIIYCHHYHLPSCTTTQYYSWPLFHFTAVYSITCSPIVHLREYMTEGKLNFLVQRKTIDEFLGQLKRMFIVCNLAKRKKVYCSN